MDIKQLIYFVTIVEEGNISQAAKKLHISQPPLSNQIKLLEDDLGLKLMERGARKITLTDAGKILYKRANNILELAKATKKELKDLENGLHGTLSLGTVSTSGSALLSKRMIDFHNTCPKVRFEIHEGNTYELIELLSAGIIEVAIVRTPFKDSNLNCIYLNEEPMVAVMKEEYDWTKKEKISIKDLKDKPLILYRRFENLITTSFNNVCIEPNIFCKNDDARTALMWANSGLGVAIMPKSALNIISTDKLVFKEINEKELNTQIAAIWIKERFLSSIAQNFLKVFKEK